MSKLLGSKEDVQNAKKIIKAFVQQVYPAASALIKDVPEQSSDSTAKTAKELVDLLTKAIKKGNVSIPVSIKVQSTSDSDDSDDDSSEEESSEEDSSEEESGDKEALKAPSTAQHRASSETISAFSVNSDDAESAMSVENSKILEVDASKPKVVVVTEEESSDSSSDSDSESDSDSSSPSDSDAQEGSLIKKIVEIVPGNKEEEESDDSSDSSSSSSSSGSDSDSQSSSSSSSSKSGSGSSSDSDSDSDSGSSSSSSSSSSSGDSSSSSESDSDSSDDSDSDSESDSDSDSDAKVGGKRKRKGISKSEPPSKRVEKITTETVASPLSTANVPTSSTPVMQTSVVKNMPRKSGSSSVNTPFQRVKSDDAVYVNDVLRDNSFDAHLARLGRDDFGAKASQKLLQTRGQGFTKAKNKLKKGSYSGGTIGMESSSFKFVYSDEE